MPFYSTHTPIYICNKIVELKKVYQAGGRTTYTWQKQPNDKYVNAFGFCLVAYGFTQLIPGYYHLATGKGKME
jgi:hypothetical protein